MTAQPRTSLHRRDVRERCALTLLAIVTAVGLWVFGQQLVDDRNAAGWGATALVLVMTQLGLGDGVLQREPARSWRAAFTDVLPALPALVPPLVGPIALSTRELVELAPFAVLPSIGALLWLVCIIARHRTDQPTSK